MKSRNRKLNTRVKNARNYNDYNLLEPRQLLAVDVGLGITSATFDSVEPFATPDTHGDIGPNHIVQVNNSEFQIRSVVGAEIQSQSLQFFWQAAGADIELGTDGFGTPILGQIDDTRVDYDPDSQRWFVSSVVSDANGDTLPGNDILLAISRTDNPVDGFRSVQFVGDTTGLHYNSFATLAVNSDGVFVTTNNEIDPINTSVSIYAIPKADLVGVTPSAINLARFENLDEATFGNTIQFATDADGDSEVAVGIGTFENGTQVAVTTIENIGTGMLVTATPSMLNVPFYSAAPDGRQVNDVARLNNISPEITGNVVSESGYLWTVHTVEGTDSNSAVRWYQIDEMTLDIVNSGNIENPDIDYLYPSIAVNEFGGVAIGFTGTGLGLQPSSMVTLGYSVVGLDAEPTVVFPQEPAIVQMGADNLVNIVDGINPFGQYSATSVDPDDPFSFVTFQEFVFADDVWGTTIGEAGITDINPVIQASDVANTIVLKRSDLNADWLEIEIDGSVTDLFEMAALDSLTLNLLDGDDTVRIDNSNGLVTTDFGFTVNAAGGEDTFEVIDSTGHQFDITGDGTLIYDFINTLTGFETLNGSDGNDVFTAANSASDWTINAGSGDDQFDVANTVTGFMNLNGMDGNDSYRLPLANFDMIQVQDSVNDEMDSLVGIGTLGDDSLTIDDANNSLVFNEEDVSDFGFDGIESLDFDGLAGNDTFNIQSLVSNAIFIGNTGDDTFNISSAAPNDGTTQSIIGSIDIRGGEGTNRITVNNRFGLPADIVLTDGQISGFTATPIIFSGQFGTLNGAQGIQLRGSDLASNNFEIAQVADGNSVLAIGGANADFFTVRSATIGDVVLDGLNGSDTYRTSFGNANRNVVVMDRGGESDRDRFSIRGNETADTLNIANNSIGNSGESVSWTGVENLVLDTRGGNDAVSVARNDTPFIRTILSEGNDMGFVNASTGISAIRFDGLAGEDHFQLNGSSSSTFIRIDAGEGDDAVEIGTESFARTRFDGQAGNDDTSIVFASRDNRRINATDTGGGNDTIVVTGTPTADRVELRARVIDRQGEFIVYDENTEEITLNLLGSNDIINVFGTAASQFNANLGIGNDVVNVHATSSPNDQITFAFNLSAGSDTANIYRISPNARVEAFGQTGNDRFNVGSTTISNDGNLNLIRGELAIGGGADTDGDDSLQINDAGAGPIPYDYIISDKRIAHDPGQFNIERPFTEFSYRDFEFVLVNGSQGRNQFAVTASLNTIIRVDGNDQVNSGANPGDKLLLNIPLGSSQRFGNDTTGFFEFTAGFQNVSFQEIEDFETTQSIVGSSIIEFDNSSEGTIMDELVGDIIDEMDDEFAI